MRNRITLWVICLFTLSFVSVSCDSDKKQLKEEQREIESFLATTDLPYSFDLKSSGLYYADVVVGTGAQPVYGNKVYVKYTCKLLSGTVIDTNEGTSSTLNYFFGVGAMISGFDEAVSYMNVGGKCVAVLPSTLAYGKSGRGSIGPYTPLLFEIELTRITN